MNFIFIRHSIYEQPKMVPSALLPHPITAEGVEQAKAGAHKIIAFFKDKENQLPQVIESSSLLRAYQTATVIAEEVFKITKIDLKITQTDALVERKMGPMANLTVQEIELIMSKDPRYENPPEGWKSSKDYKLPYIDCESLEDAGKRVAQYIQNPNILTDYEADRFRLLVGHGASFRHASRILGILKQEDIPKLSMHYAEPLFFEHTNNAWNHVSGEWKIRSLKENID